MDLPYWVWDLVDEIARDHDSLASRIPSDVWEVAARIG